MNENALRGKIVECGFNIDSFCKEAGFARSTFDRKLTGQSEFTRDEIYKIIDVLHLTDDDIRRIFFAKCVAENSNSKGE